MAVSVTPHRHLNRISQQIQSRLPELKTRYGITSLGIFGSHRHGTASETSDLDILVDYDRAPTLFQLSALQRDISRLVGIQVDIVLKKSLKPRIGPKILDEVLYL